MLPQRNLCVLGASAVNNPLVLITNNDQNSRPTSIGLSVEIIISSKTYRGVAEFAEETRRKNCCGKKSIKPLELCVSAPLR
jgi:hypothetical protein